MNEMDPDFIRMRTLAIPDRLELAEDVAEGRFTKANDVENAREILLFLQHLEGIRSRIVSDHVLNLVQDLEGRLPEDRGQMISRMETFLALDPGEQALYRLGRRQGLFVGLSDMMDPRLRSLAERLRDQLGVDAENIDFVTDQLVKRFV
jgi:hypothetical protein